VTDIFLRKKEQLIVFVHIVFIVHQSLFIQMYLKICIQYLSHHFIKNCGITTITYMKNIFVRNKYIGHCISLTYQKLSCIIKCIQE